MNKKFSLIIARIICLSLNIFFQEWASKKKKKIGPHVSCRPGRVTANQHIFKPGLVCLKTRFSKNMYHIKTNTNLQINWLFSIWNKVLPLKYSTTIQIGFSIRLLFKNCFKETKLFTEGTKTSSKRCPLKKLLHKYFLNPWRIDVKEIFFSGFYFLQLNWKIFIHKYFSKILTKAEEELRLRTPCRKQLFAVHLPVGYHL